MTTNPPALRVCFDVHVMFGWCHKWYQSVGFRYPSGPACRSTLPTDESSVKTILLKMRWIVLISSSFIPYLYSTSPLTLSCFASALSLFKLVSRRWVLRCLFSLFFLLNSTVLRYLVVISSGESFPLTLPFVDLVLLSIISIPFGKVYEKDELW